VPYAVILNLIQDPGYLDSGSPRLSSGQASPNDGINKRRFVKSTKKEISKNKIKITVAIEPEKMEEYFEAEYNRLAPSVSLPGFRAGKAPRVMTVEAIGQTRLSQAALEAAVNENFRAALKEHQTYPVTQPSISISKYPAFGEDKQQNELVFEIEFDILPKAKIGRGAKSNWPKPKREIFKLCRRS